METRIAVLPATVILRIIFYEQHLRFAPAAILFTVAHAHAITPVIAIHKSIPDQDAVVVGRYPEHGIVVVGVQRIFPMLGFAPFAKTVPFRKPDVLRITDGIVFGIPGMVFHYKEQKVTIGRNRWP